MSLEDVGFYSRCSAFGTQAQTACPMKLRRNKFVGFTLILECSNGEEADLACLADTGGFGSINVSERLSAAELRKFTHLGWVPTSPPSCADRKSCARRFSKSPQVLHCALPNLIYAQVPHPSMRGVIRHLAGHPSWQA